MGVPVFFYRYATSPRLIDIYIRLVGSLIPAGLHVYSNVKT